MVKRIAPDPSSEAGHDSDESIQSASPTRKRRRVTQRSVSAASSQFGSTTVSSAAEDADNDELVNASEVGE
jgi:hypothetical protein